VQEAAGREGVEHLPAVGGLGVPPADSGERGLGDLLTGAEAVEHRQPGALGPQVGVDAAAVVGQQVAEGVPAFLVIAKSAEAVKGSATQHRRKQLEQSARRSESRRPVWSSDAAKAAG